MLKKNPALAVSVIDLTDGRPRMIVRDYRDSSTGKIVQKSELVREMPLLDVLADACAGGARNNAASSGAVGSRMLISSDALEIVQHIQATVQGYGSSHDMKAQMRAWAAACEADAPDTERVAAAVAYHWCERIRALHYTEHELDAACPICGEFFVRYADPAGGWVQQRALCWNVTRAMCRGCGEIWEGEHGMRDLAASIHRRI